MSIYAQVLPTIYWALIMCQVFSKQALDLINSSNFYKVRIITLLKLQIMLSEVKQGTQLSSGRDGIETQEVWNKNLTI